MRHRTRSSFASVVTVTMVASAAIGTALADDHGFRTDTFVGSFRNECQGVPDCGSTLSPRVTVAGMGRKSARIACPADRPNLWNWDSGQHEQIQVRLIARDASTVTVEGVNFADVPGDFAVSVGCSAQANTGTAFHLSRQLAPTGALSSRMPPPSVVQGVQGTPVPGKKAGSSICDGVPFCQEVQEPAFQLGGWDTAANRYTCQAPYPFAWGNFTWSQTGYPSVSGIGANDAAYPMDQDILFTNWNLFQNDIVYPTIACSQTNPWTSNSCGTPVFGDQNCPVVSGSSHTYCSRGSLPVCVGVWQERCTANNQLYSCTTYVGITYCQPCPG